ncbi:hypothetical protein LOD99_7141 [Oopsacas minuta]|uniref:Uncharacterized protein n=1 Tax=Oopsacas minuta TaxID=111878 RepID=A0AAV7JJV2_9METZ|nr:hypothetical protein LOD99_7141 [Oopsacas minuta]
MSSKYSQQLTACSSSNSNPINELFVEFHIKEYRRKGGVMYISVPAAGCDHLTVNNSENFVDPIIGILTQRIENAWWGVSRKDKEEAPTTNPHLLESHLIEACWIRRE